MPDGMSFIEGGAIDNLSGMKIKGMGKDTQLIAAQPGEVMMSRKAVDMYGADTLLGMNAAAGGTNKPKYGKVPGFSDGGQVGRVVISAGHYNTGFNKRGIPIGSDGVPVDGTTDPGTGVAEFQATKHLIDSLKMLVDAKGLGNKIGFENITAATGTRGMRGTAERVESTPGTQFIDLHFDQHAQGGRPGSAGRSGIISRNHSAVDSSLARMFGDFGKDFKKGKLAVAEGGGTILELAAIDDPAIRSLLEEVKRGEQGPASRAMADKILQGILPGIGSAPKKTKTKMSGLTPTKQDLDWYNNIMNPETKPANPKPEPPGRQPKPDFLQLAPAFMQQPTQQQIPSQFKIPNANIPQGFRSPQQPGT